MKKLVLILSFVFAIGLVAVNAQNTPKKVVKKAPAKTEVAAKPESKAPDKKAVHKGHKKSIKKVVAPAK